MIPKPLTGSGLKIGKIQKGHSLHDNVTARCRCFSIQNLLGPVHTYPFFFENGYSPPPPPSLTHRPHVSGGAVTENGSFQKRSPEWRFLKTRAFRLRVDVRKRRFSNTMMSYIIYCKSSIKPPGKLNFFKHFWEGKRDLIERGGLFKLFSETHQREQVFSRTDLWFPGIILLFVTIRKW